MELEQISSAVPQVNVSALRKRNSVSEARISTVTSEYACLKSGGEGCIPETTFHLNSRLGACSSGASRQVMFLSSSTE